MRKIILGSLLACLGLSTAQAQVWNDSLLVNVPGSTAPTQFKAWFPAQPSPLQAILLVNGRGAGLRFENSLALSSDVRTLIANKKVGIVVFNPSNFNAVDTALTPTGADSVFSAITRFGLRNSKPELANIPVITYGQGLGANVAYQLGVHSPARTAAVIVSNAKYLQTSPAWASQPPFSAAVNNLSAVPQLYLTGEAEGPEVYNNAAVYNTTYFRNFLNTRRASGQPIQLAIVKGGTTNGANLRANNYIATFVFNTVDARIPANSNGTNPVTLNAVVEANGWLGQQSNINSLFDAALSVGSFTGGLPAAQSSWFYNQTAADAWKAFQVTNLDFRPNPPLSTVSAAFPLSSGRNVGGFLGDYKVKNFTTAQFPAGNIFRVELSNAAGEFDNPMWPSRIIATIRRADTALTNNAQTPVYPVVMADNLQAEVGTNGLPRYRFRLHASGTSDVSALSQEVRNVNINGRFGIVVGAVYNKMYRLGDRVNLKIYRDSLALASLPAGSEVVIEMSDSTGSFARPTVIGSKVTTISNYVSRGWYKDSIDVEISGVLGRGIKYRMRAVVNATPRIIGSTNGSDLNILNNGPLTSVEELEYNADRLKVFPNPSNKGWNVYTINTDLGSVVVSDLSGRTVAEAKIFNGQAYIDNSGLKTGTYIIRTVGTAGSFVTRAVKE